MPSRAWFAKPAGSKRQAFCFINYTEPHAPYDPTKKWRDQFLEEGEESEKLGRWQRANWRSDLADHRFGGAEVDDPRQWLAMSQQLRELRAGGLRADDPALGDLPELSKDAIKQLKALGYLN